ncbi:MAG: PEP-CTERM sorting domain-containing protein [Akkermansiaceae bacterium]|jgi:hypothetical protein|nr:PEP-CTERM sorting domain-containing protein [Akkermansiaceae bacterium]
MKSTSALSFILSGALCALSQAAIITVGGSGQTSSDFLYFTPTLAGSPASFGMEVSASSGMLAVRGDSGKIIATTYGGVGEVGFYSHSGVVFSQLGSAPTVDLATVSSWVGGDKAGVAASTGDQFVFGWRWRPVPTESYRYGWTVVEYGSITHIGSTANDTPGGSITFSAVPEPTSVSLVALSALGLTFSRRRSRRA